MAKRKSSRKSKSAGNWIAPIISVITNPQVIGLTLILISAFTLLSLITNSRGLVTSAWIQGVEYLFGLGAWGFPFALGALGFWVVIAAVERMENIPVQRPIGFLILLVVVSISASLIIPQGARMFIIGQGDDGGLIGGILANLLQDVIGLWGAWAVTTVAAIVGLVLLTDQLLAKAADVLWSWLREWWQTRPALESAPPVPRMPQIQPELPLPSGRLPLWKRVRELITSPSGEFRPSDLSAGEFAKEPLFRPNNERQNRKRSASSTARTDAQPSADHQNTTDDPDNRRSRQTVQATDTSNSQVANGKSDAQTASGPVAPRIIGGDNQWQKFELPELSDVLMDWERVTDNDDHIRDQGAQIQETLALFGVPVSFEGVNQGPTVTQYLIRPGYDERVVKGEVRRTKVKVSKIANLSSDLALALAAATVRIEAPVPGTSYVGIEVPNQSSNIVGLRELMESERFEDIREKGKLPIALGEDVKGNAIVSDLARMPHMLIAGATGSGKSVCINSIIISLICTKTPESLRMLMIDPKMVELSVYNKIPHLLSPVVTETDKASGVLYWAVKEMERRYQLCSKANCRDLERYNAYLQKRGEKPLPYIVVIVDEMADLMMAAPEEVEKHICRLAQMARAIGIHMIIATQRPSVDVITGLIKANFPSRIAFAVSSQTDSRVILDSPGADRLLGKGDMLFMAPDGGKLQRLQGTFLNDDEINNVVGYWKSVSAAQRERQALAAPQTDLFHPVDEAENAISGQEGAPQADPFAPEPFTLEPFTDDPLALTESVRTSPPTKSRSRSNKKSASSPPPRRPMTTPGASRLDITPIQDADGQSLGQQSYGAPPEQPSIFDEIEEMRALDSRDELFEDAIRIVQETGRGSVSLLQRKLRIGYNRAGRLVEQLEEAGYLGPDRGGSHGRKVLKKVQNQAVAPFDDDMQMSDMPEPKIIGSNDDVDPAAPRVWM